MKSATITTKLKSGKVRVESKTNRTADVDVSTTLR